MHEALCLYSHFSDAFIDGVLIPSFPLRSQRRQEYITSSGVPNKPRHFHRQFILSQSAGFLTAQDFTPANSSMEFSRDTIAFRLAKACAPTAIVVAHTTCIAIGIEATSSTTRC